MKPLNLDNSPCSPISSNCVIWQGPNMPCINLCTGDTVSDVVYKLALELCEILDQLNITNYDLACLNLPCPPADFQALIQILINKICELENIPVPAPQPDGGNCPTDCIVQVVDCLGGGTDNLVNYVNTIANKICELANSVKSAETSIEDINITIINLQTQIDNIPTYTLPDIDPDCTIGVYSGPTRLDTLFEAFLNDVWCPFSLVVGTPAEISAVLNPACALTDIVSEPGWINPVTNLADSINNIWVSICYLYDNVPVYDVVGSGNITVSSVTAGNLTTFTVGTTINPLETLNEGVSLTTDTASMNFVGDLVNATTVGDNVTVTVNTFGGMLAQEQPANLNSVAFGLGNVLCFQPVQIIAEIYDDDNAYNPLTGVWTCPATGRYNLSCYAHYTKDSGDGWYDSLNPGGMFGVGIFSSTGCNFYCANWMTIMGIQKHIDITAQAMGMVIAAGTQLSVKVLNQTGFNYTSTTGDGLRFSIERIK